MYSLHQMWFSSLLLFSPLLFPHLTTGTCCNWCQFCRCNFFGCNCDFADNGCCYQWQSHVDSEKLGECYSPKDGPFQSYCPERWSKRRTLVIDAKKQFLKFDQNKDGQISFSEAMRRYKKDTCYGISMIHNGNTIGEFKKVDKNNDGIIRPWEFDKSLCSKRNRRRCNAWLLN